MWRVIEQLTVLIRGCNSNLQDTAEGTEGTMHDMVLYSVMQ